MTNIAKPVPRSVLTRLTHYYATVQSLRSAETEWVSSTELADVLGLTSSTVRQDISHLDFAGVSKRGYETSGLEAALASALGADKIWNLVIVGAGNLGRALALHEEFQRRGFVIHAVFDDDKAKVGRKVGKLEILAMDGLAAVVRKRAIDVGVIAVPGPSAQDVADRLVAAGIKGLLNLSSVHIASPDDVAVSDTRIIASLQELTFALMAKV